MNGKFFAATSIFFLMLTGLAAAAVEDISLIRQDCSGQSVRCYTSLADWQSAKGGIPRGDLVAADRIAVAQIDGAWSLPDTKYVAISGWKTDPAHYIKVITTLAARHKGIPGSGYQLNISATPSYVFFSDAAYIKVIGLEVYSSNPAVTASAMYFRPADTTAGVGNVEISHCLVHGNGTNTSAGISFYAFSGVSRIFNNLVYDVGYPGYSPAIGPGSGSAYVYNNTIGSTINGFGIRSDTPAVVKNNLVLSSGTCFYGVFSGGSDYNVCQGASSSGGPHDKINQTVTLMDPAARDYRLSSADTVALGAGVNLSYDFNLSFTDDLLSWTRYGKWDIGAFQYSDGTIPADVTPPSAPAGLKTEAVAAEAVTLSWNPSTDNTGVKGYNIYRNGTLIDTADTNRYIDTATVAYTSYDYVVQAFDASFNLSPLSGTVALTTPLPADKTPPHMVVLKAKVSAPGTVTLSWATDEPSSTQVEYGAETAYGKFSVASLILGVNHTAVISGLDNAAYHFRARSKDAAGNEAVSPDIAITLKPSLGATRYVDSQNVLANDGNDGTQARPWLTIQHAADVAQPGDTILVMPGNYGRTRIYRSGLPGYFITFKAVNPPVMDHVDFQAAYDPAHPRQYPGNPDVNAVTKGFAFYPTYGSKLDIGYIRVENFEITSIVDPLSKVSASGGILLSGSSIALVHDVELVKNFIHDLNPNPQAYDYIGIRGEQYSSNIRVQENTFFHVQGTNLGISGKDWLVVDNEVSHSLDSNTDSGLEVGGDSDASRFFGTGHIIRNNYLHDCLDTEQFGEPHIDCFQTFSVWPDTQYADHILVEGNYCKNMGQMLMSEDSSEGKGTGNAVHDITFRNNIFQGARAQSIIVGIDHFTFVNNVVADSHYAGLNLNSDVAYSAVVLNNIFYMSAGSAPSAGVRNKATTIYDYNIHYPDFTWPNKQPDFEKHSQFGVDPLFVDPAHGNFHLKAGSPAIGAGIRWVGFDKDRDGRNRSADAWEIGAYAYSDGSMPPVTGGAGDVSGDGRVTMYDAALVLKYTVGGSLTTVQQVQADMNGDAAIDASDAMATAKRALGIN
ncbi:MAG: dockerin type I domain-containing protein [Candidatus Omnitrophota bacterium]